MLGLFVIKNLSIFIVIIVLIVTGCLSEAMPFSLFNVVQILSIPFEETQAEKYIDLIIMEAEARQNELSETVHTVYIGGGTPSLLSPFLLKKLCDNIRRLFSISDVIEYHNKENSVDINFDDDLFKYINNYRENKKIKNIKKNKEKNKNNSFVKERKTCNINIEEYKIKGNKKIKNNKIKGRTSLIMSVINDNLLGNFEHNNYIKDNSYLYNKCIKNNERLKRNSIY